MSWSTDDGKHEAWLAPTFADGAFGTGSSGEGIQVSRIGQQMLAYDEWQYRPESDVIGWTTVCECGWRGPLWTRVATEAEQDLDARRVYSADAWAEHLEDDLSYAEWKRHTAPHVALAEVALLASQKSDIQRRLEAAITKAKAAGASDAEITRATW